MAAALRRPGVAPGEVDGPALRAALGRRGPDSVASWAGDDVEVWASRLVLWEEGDARQPFVGDDLVACFNGELFNLDELRAHLGLGGCSEVEVLARGVAAEGPAFLRRVDGQVAGVVVDRRAGTATVVRDRFGICPLYWATTASGTFVASDAQALFAITPDLAPTGSLDGLAAVVCEWAPTAPGSVWQGVRQLVPGTALVVRGGVVEDVVVWAATPAEHLPDPGGDVDRLAELVRDAVASRTRSVGDLAVTLSGGVDSTVIGALAAELGVRRSFGLVVPGEDVVRERQEHVAGLLGLEHTVHELRPGDVVDLLVELVATRMVPLVRLGPVGMASLARFVRRHGVTAVLCGEGADEVFSGYDSYRVLAGRAGLLGPVEDLDWAELGEPEFGAGRGPVFARAYWRNLVQLAERADVRRSRVMAPVLDLVAPALRDAVAARWAAEPDPARTEHPLDARREEDLRDLLASYLLTVQGDHAWMEEGVEQRPPYLANAVASWALHRPAAAHVSRSQGKLPVRGVLARLADRRPELAGIDFDKSAYRLDAAFLLRDPLAWTRFTDLVERCPEQLLDVAAVRRRADACARAGRCSEQESMLLVLAASLGVLADAGATWEVAG